MNKRTLHIILFLLVVSVSAFSQLEQKFTLNFSVGMVNPFGESDYVLSNIESSAFTGTFAQPSPYLFSNFGAGAIFTGGIQINYNRRFSLAFNGNFFTIRKWAYDYEFTIMTPDPVTTSGSALGWTITETDIDPDSPTDAVVASGENRLTMYNIAVGAMPKFHIFPGKQFNPYLFGELNLNFTDLKLDNTYGNAKENYGIQSIDYEPVEEIIEQSLGFGFYPGIGVDININENLGAYIQSGFSYIFINNNDLKKKGYAAENFKTFKFELGVKFSFLRSRNL